MPLFLLFTLTILVFPCCRNQQDENVRDFILTEKDLIPEGLAFDPATQTIYVSSTHKRKIVLIDKPGQVRDFISSAQDDIKSVVGMEADPDRNSLWAISSEANPVLPLINPGPDQWRSALYQYELTDGSLIRKYTLHRDSVFLNDLAVAPDGTVYITESRQRGLFSLKPGTDSILVFLDLPEHRFVNGICFTDKPGFVFVCTPEGILSVDLDTKQYSLLPSARDIHAGGIDGLAFYDNYFIAHQSSRVMRFYLSPGRDSITRADTLDSGPEFDSSTTGEVSGGFYYYIVNSQIRSGVDYDRALIKPADSLENIIIRKRKLSP